MYNSRKSTITADNHRTMDELQINYVGEIDMLPDDIKAILDEVKQACGTSTPKKFTFNLAIAYDYNKDIVNTGSGEYPNYNRTQSDVDVLFRSGGEFRTSGFFPTKILYSELFFSKKLWPDVTLRDINNIIRKFYKRNRRFGK